MCIDSFVAIVFLSMSAGPNGIFYPHGGNLNSEKQKSKQIVMSNALLRVMTVFAAAPSLWVLPKLLLVRNLPTGGARTNAFHCPQMATAWASGLNHGRCIHRRATHKTSSLDAKRMLYSPWLLLNSIQDFPILF